MKRAIFTNDYVHIQGYVPVTPVAKWAGHKARIFGVLCSSHTSTQQDYRDSQHIKLLFFLNFYKTNLP